MIAHHFPPEGAAGVHRPLRFVRHLPKIGWRPVVIACEQAAYERYDPGLLGLVPPETEIRRVRAWDPWQALQAARVRRNETRRGRSVHGVGGEVGSRRETRPPCLPPGPRAQDRGMVLSPRPGDAVDSAGRERSGETRACRHRPMSSGRRQDRSPPLPSRIEPRAGRVCLTCSISAMPGRSPTTRLMQDAPRGRSAEIVKRSPGCCGELAPWSSGMRRRRNVTGAPILAALEASRVHIIPNGYDGAIDTSPVPRGERCTILYTGTLISYRYDTLLEALRQFKQRDPARAGLPVLRVCRRRRSATPAKAELLGLSDLFEIREPGLLRRDHRAPPRRACAAGHWAALRR